MPQARSKRDERQYEHIRKRARARGASKRRPRQIPARTVNNMRRDEGRTPQRRTQGKGKPGKRLNELTVDELRNMASDLEIEGRSTMNKRELLSAIQRSR